MGSVQHRNKFNTGGMSSVCLGHPVAE